MMRRLYKLLSIFLGSLLGLFGLGGLVAETGCKPTAPKGNDPGSRPSPTPDKPPPALKKDSSELRIKEVTAEARAVISGSRGQHPFDRAGKEKLLSAIKGAEGDVDDLVAAGTISEGAGGLWKQDLRHLAGQISGYRPSEMRMASCYEPMPMPVEARKSGIRLKARLTALEKLATADKLNPKVVRKVLIQVEADLKVLESTQELGRLQSDKERAAARAIFKEVKAKVERIKAKLAGKKPQGGMAVINDFFATIKPLAEDSGSSTTLQRQAAEAKMKKALAALKELVAAGELSEGEAKLMRLEAERLDEAMGESPPADMQVRCYRRAYIQPAKRSLKRLNQRLPLLEKLAAGGKIKPGVMARMLPALEQDLKILSDPKQLKRLPKKDQAGAGAAAAKARKVLERPKKLKQGE